MAAVGKSLVEALHEKYDYEANDDEGNSCVVFVHLPKGAPGTGACGIKVPQHLVLSNCGITSAGDAEQLRNYCREITSLDLESNEIQDFGEVVKILHNTPNCAFLSLRANPLKEISQDWRGIIFGSVKQLVLNELGLLWSSVEVLLSVFPNLTELHMSKNGYKSVNFPDTEACASLRTLLFSNNELTEWQEVQKFGRKFPNLDQLVLLSNPLPGLPHGLDLMQDFSKLTYINISDTKIESWGDVEKFRYFPSLIHLKAFTSDSVGLPLFKGYDESTTRYLLLGYLPNLKFLNGSRLTETEKEDAERAFVQHFMNQSDRPKRYAELHDKLGDLHPLVELDFAAKTTPMVTVTVFYDGKNSLQSFPVHMTLARLKKELRRILAIPTGVKFQVWYEDRKHLPTLERTIYPDRRVLYPNKSLLRYNVEDGDAFHIETD